MVNIEFGTDEITEIKTVAEYEAERIAYLKANNKWVEKKYTEEDYYNDMCQGYEDYMADMGDALEDS